MRDLKSLLRFFLAVSVAGVITGHVGAQTAVPILINYQGELRSPTTGEPVPDGSYEMRFRIYDAESGGTLLWTGN